MHFSRGVFVATLASCALARPQGVFPGWENINARAGSSAQASNNFQPKPVQPEQDNGFHAGYGVGWEEGNPIGREESEPSRDTWAYSEAVTGDKSWVDGIPVVWEEPEERSDASNSAEAGSWGLEIDWDGADWRRAKKHPNQPQPVQIPNPNQAFESDCNDYLSHTRLPVPIASLKSAISQFLHDRPTYAPLPTAPIPTFVSSIIKHHSNLGGAATAKPSTHESSSETKTGFWSVFSRLSTSALSSQTPAVPSTHAQHSTKEVFISIPTINSLRLGPGPVVLLTNSADEILPTASLASHEPFQTIHAHPAATEPVDPVGNILSEISNVESNLGNTAVPSTPVMSSETLPSTSVSINTAIPTTDFGPYYSKLASILGEIFPTGGPELSSILSQVRSHAPTPTNMASLSDYMQLSSVLQYTATSLPAQETKLSSVLSEISSKFGGQTNVPSAPVESRLSSLDSSIRTTDAPLTSSLLLTVPSGYHSGALESMLSAHESMVRSSLSARATITSLPGLREPILSSIRSSVSKEQPTSVPQSAVSSATASFYSKISSSILVPTLTSLPTSTATNHKIFSLQSSISSEFPYGILPSILPLVVRLRVNLAMEVTQRQHWAFRLFPLALPSRNCPQYIAVLPAKNP